MRKEEILALAKRQLGVREEPMGSNRVKYNTAYYGREVSGSLVLCVSVVAVPCSGRGRAFLWRGEDRLLHGAVPVL